MRLPALLVPLCFASAALVASCSSASDVPLGGPYGGTATAAPPTDAGNDTGPTTIIGSGPGVGTGTGSGNGTGTGTGTGIEIGTGTGTGTGIGIGTGTGFGTGTGKGAGTGTGTGTGTGGAPTWTYLYDTYLAETGTPGSCDGSCHHHSQCGSASACYSWIGTGYNLGTGGNLFSWDSQGWMPTHGPSSEPQADTDFDAWIAAGSKNN